MGGIYVTPRCGASLAARDAPPEQHQVMIDDLVAIAFGHPALKLFDLGRQELDHLAGVDVDQVVVVGGGLGLEPRGPGIEAVGAQIAALGQRRQRAEQKKEG